MFKNKLHVFILSTGNAIALEGWKLPSSILWPILSERSRVLPIII